MVSVCWCVQGASKGNAVDRILKKLADEGNAPDFVLCIGDDRSDEDMFIAMEHVTFSPHLPAEVCPLPLQLIPLTLAPKTLHPKPLQQTPTLLLHAAAPQLHFACS